MNKIVELPLVPPVYSTYHNGILSAVNVKNPTIRNWYLNEVMILTCDRKFLSGFTSPQIGIEGCELHDNPYLDKRWFSMQFLRGYVNPIIRNLINSGYYVMFSGIDDYYVKGKSWYKEKHFSHDGAICGYNREDKTYCIYAYDSNWVYQKFWTPQKCFEAGRKAMFKKWIYGNICGIKPKQDNVEFLPFVALRKIEEYLDSDLRKYPFKGKKNVRGIVVHNYIAKYVSKLYDGSIPYERMDRRVFRLIWEHKKVMLERIQKIEEALNITPDISKKYVAIVKEADNMRMLYASYHLKRRDSILTTIQKKLLNVKKKEQKLLKELIEKTKGLKEK